MTQDGVKNISDKEFNQLAGFVKENFGINLGHEKKSLLVGRLCNVLTQNHFDSFSEYFNYVVSDRTGDALITLLDKITTNHTFFMREVEHFEYFKEKVLPYFEASVSDSDLRIWSAGCSTGEEPYTLAMIIDEYFRAEKAKWNTKILATDISTKALDIAEKGEYSEEQIANISRHWKLSYFQRAEKGKFAVINKIKQEILFRRFNLIEEIFPFKKKFHVIFCRNVMIYFDTRTKKELVEKFYDCTEPGGYLFTGHSETLNNLKTEYKYVMPALYRKE